MSMSMLGGHRRAVRTPSGSTTAVLRALRERLPLVASQTVAAVTAEVPGYSGASAARWARTSRRPSRWPSVASSSWPAGP